MKIVLSILVLFFSTQSMAYDGLPQSQVDSFFKELATSNTSKAVDNLYSSNPLFAEKSQNLVMLKQQVMNLEPLYGKFLGAENIINEKLSPSLIRIVQLAKYEKHPIVWEFYFYKKESNWAISQGIFGDRFENISSKK